MKSTNRFLVYLLKQGYPYRALDSLEVAILLPLPPKEPMTFQRERNGAQRGKGNCPRLHSRLRQELLRSCPLADLGSHSREDPESHPWGKVTPGIRSGDQKANCHPSVCPLGQTDRGRSPRPDHKRTQPGGEKEGKAGRKGHPGASAPHDPRCGPGRPRKSGQRKEVQREGDLQGEKHAGHLPRPRLGLREHPAPVQPLLCTL